MTDKEPSSVQDPTLKTGTGGGGLKIPALNMAQLAGQTGKYNQSLEANNGDEM